MTVVSDVKRADCPPLQICPGPRDISYIVTTSNGTTSVEREFIGQPNGTRLAIQPGEYKIDVLPAKSVGLGWECVNSTLSGDCTRGHDSGNLGNDVSVQGVGSIDIGETQKCMQNEVLLSVIEDAQTQILANNSKIKLSVSLDKSLTSSADAEKHDGPIFIEADRERITQVLYNLLDNAIKFSEEGIISLGVERKRNNKDNDDAKRVIVINVKDTGSGIHSEIMPKLFSKFASRSFSGTGLGLYISKGIVEAHGGRIWAENNPDEKGASFSFSLPLD